MSPQEQALRQALAAAPTQGPWQVRIGRDKQGLTGYQVLTHTHAAVCVAAADYYLAGQYPDTDEHGYCLPDEGIDCFPHQVATARYIAAAHPLAIKSIVDELDRARAEVATWRKRATSSGRSDTET